MLIELAILSGVTGYWKTHRERHRPLVQRLTTLSVQAVAPASTTPPNQPGFSAQRLWRDLKAALQTDGRQQLQQDIDPQHGEESAKAKREARRQLLLSSGAAGVALLAGSYPVLYLLGVGAVLYTMREMFTWVMQDFRRGHYLNLYLLELVSLLWMMAVGQLFLAAIGGILFSFFMRLINRVEDNSQQHLLRVFGEHPSQVWVLKDGVELQVDFHALQPSDIVVVNAGEVIPVDGTVVVGEGQVDQHLLTGESQPVEKLLNDQVFASTLLLSGRLQVSVTTAGNATLAAQIGEVLNQTQSYKDTLMTRGRQVADRFVPVVLGLSAVTFPLLGSTSALAVTWSGLGETIWASGPLSLLSYLQILSQHSILVKDGRVFESLHQVDTIVFDKTGTLTLEQPTVGQIHALSGFTVETVLRYAAAAEYRQPHPVARAILAKAQEAGLELPEIDEASYDVGYGITVEVDGFTVRVGSARFLQREGIEFPAEVAAIQQEAEAESHSLIYVGLKSQLAGILEMHPTLRPEAPAVVRFLQQRGIQLYIISGDHAAPTRKMAERLGIDHYFAETLPENKAARVQELRDAGRFVCFIGDGINDAIALKAAQVSISLKGASTAATDTAQIIFMDSTLKRLPHLFQLMDEFEGTMRRNLALSIVPGSITIGGIYLLHFGVAASMGIYYAGAVAALGNTLWPLVKHQRHDHPFDPPYTAGLLNSTLSGLKF